MINLLRVSSALFAFPLFAALLVGCSAQVGYRTYDPYYHDYHTWSGTETPYYNQSIIETQPPARGLYRHLNRRDRDDYWKWRHNRGDHDRDDRDRR